MSEIRSFEPLWGVWRTTELIGRGAFGAVWRAERVDEAGFASAIKHIALPSSDAEVQALYDEGIARDAEAVHAYYSMLRESLISEIRFMYAFRDEPNIVTYEDHIVFQRAGVPGYDVFIRMELLKSLSAVGRGGMLPPEQVCHLGIDICTALCALKKRNVVHRDIKPANILVSTKGVYKLADFGVARQMEKTGMVLSKKGTYAYMSPEVYKGEVADETSDLYSLGLVMHRLLNANRAPFLPLFSAVSAEDAEISVMRRMSGQEIPHPAYAPPALGIAICHACAYRPAARFRTPEEFRAALEDCLVACDETVFISRQTAMPAPVPEPKKIIPVRAPEPKRESPARVPEPVLPPAREHAIDPEFALVGELPYYLRPEIRIAPEKRKTSTKVVIAIFIITAVLAMIALLTSGLFLYKAYQDAAALAEEGRYGEAYEKYAKISFFLDSAERAEEWKQAAKPQIQAYEDAVALSDEGWYSKAYDLFSGLGNFRDSAKRAQECATYMDVLEHIVYQIMADGTCKIAMYTGNRAEVYVPPMLRGCPITVICSYTFYNCSALTDLYIPDSIALIGEEALSDRGVQIHCAEGSYAQQYAIDNGFKCVLSRKSHKE